MFFVHLTERSPPYFNGHNSDLSLNLPQLKLFFRKVATYQNCIILGLCCTT